MPIGNNIPTFTGQLNGNNQTINNLYINSASTYVGLFGTFSNGNTFDTISNLGLINPIIISSSSGLYVGGIAGQASGAVRGVYTLGGSITGLNIQEEGGLIGNFSSGVILSSYNSANVSASATFSEFVGGLVGYGPGVVISNSYNTGAITVNGTGTGDVGGLIGYQSQTSLSQTSMITASYNTGPVTGTGAATGVGGLVGYMEGVSNGTNYIQNSYNSGTVIGLGSSAVGGLVGDIDLTNGNKIISNSYNIGTVQDISSSSAYVGGIVGEVNTEGTSNTVTISDTYNSGNVSALSGNTNVGGVAGYLGVGAETAQTTFTEDFGIRLHLDRRTQSRQE